jgi:hypothetical protein
MLFNAEPTWPFAFLPSVHPKRPVHSGRVDHSTCHYDTIGHTRTRLLLSSAVASGFWGSELWMASHASKKRRPEEQVEEEMHLAFRGAANALSQVYTPAVAHQKASYLAGERRAMVCGPPLPQIARLFAASLH